MKMRVAVVFVLLISFTMAFKIQEKNPDLLEEKQDDPVLLEDGQDNKVHNNRNTKIRRGYDHMITEY